MLEVMSNSNEIQTQSSTTKSENENVPAASNGNGPDNQYGKKSRKTNLSLVLPLVILLLAGAGVAGYMLGGQNNDDSRSDQPAIVADQDEERGLSVPNDATVISQCAEGKGSLHVRPQDIPQGPVYIVHEGEVIGIEFMVGQEDLMDEGKSLLDLPLFDMEYDHVNIGLLSQGHAGYPSPHYHVDIMSVPKSVTDTITCE